MRGKEHAGQRSVTEVVEEPQVVSVEFHWLEREAHIVALAEAETHGMGHGWVLLVRKTKHAAEEETAFRFQALFEVPEWPHLAAESVLVVWVRAVF